MDKRARKQRTRRYEEAVRRRGRRAELLGRGYGGRAAAGMNRAFLEDDEPGLYDDVGDVARSNGRPRPPRTRPFSGRATRREDDGGDFDSRMKAAGRAAPMTRTRTRPQVRDERGYRRERRRRGDGRGASSEPAVQRKRRVIADEDEDEDAVGR